VGGCYCDGEDSELNAQNPGRPDLADMAIAAKSGLPGFCVIIGNEIDLL
jgi:hypothetical protein